MKRYLLILIIFLAAHFVFAQEKADLNATRFQQEIDNFSAWDAKNATPDSAILFIGSSSIRFWKTHDAFPNQPVINRGFGGAHISDMIYYYDQIAKPFNPDVIVFYCGDNDIEYGKPVEQVYADFLQIMDSLATDFPEAHFVYLPIKPCQSRWSYWPKMQKFNEKVAAYCDQNKLYHYLDTASPMLGEDGKPNSKLYRDDALHLNEDGYKIWDRLLANLLAGIKND
ncbi:MAG TPA: GDSL-type esterase/lipase family protein [Bacteroidales bacterium]|nr:hypothetical protein [Bacteroidales bacterium]HPE57633.1 GDSL-type esterase/lipase family protein [Bacteroidales bacterium]HRX96589.1 GDSL-type esterase/lipase family protein [Bacteroidales bacterium]